MEYVVKNTQVVHKLIDVVQNIYMREAKPPRESMIEFSDAGLPIYKLI